MKVIALGECMLEVKVEKLPEARFSYGGDTFNTAYYLTLLDVETEYATALGCDGMSDWLMAEWQQLGIATRLVKQISGKTPGLYMIQTDPSGERSFSYWRNDSAARLLFADSSKDEWLESCQAADMFYFSLISLAVLQPDTRSTLIALLAELKARGVTIAFDNNYRPLLWQDNAEALYWLQQAIPFVDIYLPGVEDEMAIFGLVEQDLVPHLTQLGIAEIVAKNGGAETILMLDGELSRHPSEPLSAVDTTAAGDSFNAGYLAARLRQCPPEEALVAGHQIASQVIMHPGALVPIAELDLTLSWSDQLSASRR